MSRFCTSIIKALFNYSLSYRSENTLNIMNKLLKDNYLSACNWALFAKPVMYVWEILTHELMNTTCTQFTCRNWSPLKPTASNHSWRVSPQLRALTPHTLTHDFIKNKPYVFNIVHTTHEFTKQTSSSQVHIIIYIYKDMYWNTVHTCMYITVRNVALYILMILS